MLSWANGCHIGDCLFALSYLRRCAGDHTLHVLPEFVEALRPLANDSRIHIADTSNLPANAEDTWMANGRHESKGLFFRNQEDIMGFVYDYFNAFGPAWQSREDMLFDWHWLRPLRWRDSILILNTQPMSGQCPGYSQSELNRLAVDLTLAGHRVVMVNDKDTEQHQYSLLQIACLSASAQLIIGGASGPFFVTMNTAAKDCHRIVLLDPMRIDYGPNVGPISMAKNVSEVRTILKGMNFLRYL